MLILLSGVCPTGWLQNKDRCYETNVVSGYWQTWFSAQQHCQSTGTSLLIIDR
ncbi:hypothetical protein DPMN_114997 [Dreissena polymorpha]|uniref:C-type lectin domain-containing protein n=1 Tax=Dreissena polymorpha TaxID=45954 RepID=A0A9D4QS28_DREPO|nr:hypothetical protein DPMN_114997 [Dreissena polymorpha]